MGHSNTNAQFASTFLAAGSNPGAPMACFPVIKYHVAQKGPVEVAIFNFLGQKVCVLVGAVQAPGSYEVRWDGRDNLGKRVSSGVYVYQLKAGEFTQARKMIFLQ
jgi:hypothetical protein